MSTKGAVAVAAIIVGAATANVLSNLPAGEAPPDPGPDAAAVYLPPRSNILSAKQAAYARACVEYVEALYVTSQDSGEVLAPEAATWAAQPEWDAVLAARAALVK